MSGQSKNIKMINQKNIIKALNEQKYLRNLQNDFKPKILFRENRSKAPRYVQLPKSVESADSSAQTMYSEPPQSYLTVDDDGNSPMSIESFISIDDEKSPFSPDETTLDKSVETIKEIFDSYSNYKFDKKNDLANPSSPRPSTGNSTILTLDSPRPSTSDSKSSDGSLKPLTPLQLDSRPLTAYSDSDYSNDSTQSTLKFMSLLKEGSPKLYSFLNSIKSFEIAKENDNPANINNINIKKNVIKRIFIRSPDSTSSEGGTDSTSSEGTESSSFSLSLISNEDEDNNSIGSGLTSMESDDSPKTKSPEIIIRNKNRIVIKKNIINKKISKLVPLKISFFGGNGENMTYVESKKEIQNAKDELSGQATPSNIQVLNLENDSINDSLNETLNASLNSQTPASLTNQTPTSINDSMNNTLNASINSQTPTTTNAALNSQTPTSLNDSLNNTLNASLNSKTPASLTNQTPTSINDSLNNTLNASINSQNPTSLNPSLSKQVTSPESNRSLSDSLTELLNLSLNGKSSFNKPKKSSHEQKYVVEITFDNETLEPTDIIINRAEEFKKIEDKDKPSNYLFSVNQFIMEQIKTKNRGYILEGETTMACYCSDDVMLDFDTPIFTF